MTESDITAKRPPPTTADRLSITINKAGAEPEHLALSLDMYIRQIYSLTDSTSGSNDITWPSHYQERWKQQFTQPGFKKSYMAGVTSTHQWNARREDEDTLTVRFIEALWQLPIMASKIATHPQLRLMSLSSTLTLNTIDSGGVAKSRRMSLLDFLLEESERYSQTNKATISDPAGLLISDTLLQEFIEESKQARIKNIQILQLEKASKTLNVPTTEGLLQEALDEVVKEYSPNTAYPGKLLLKDTIKVEFRSNYKDILNRTALPIPRLIEHTLTPPTAPEIKEFTLSQIMSKLALRYGDTKGFIGINYDTENKYPREIINRLHSEDWQVNLIHRLETYRTDDEQRQAWATIFSPVLHSKIPYAYKHSPITSIKYNSQPLPGVFKIRTGRTSFQLRSIFSTTFFEFNDRSQMRRAHDLLPRKSHEPRREHEDFLPWLREHQGTYYNDNYGHSMSTIPADSLGAKSSSYERFNSARYPQDDETLNTPLLMTKLMFDHLLTQLKDDVDTYIKSDIEVFTHKVFQLITDIGLYVGLALLPLSGPVALLLSAGLAALPFLETTVADTQEEARSIFMTSLLNSLIDYSWGGIGDVPSVKKALVGQLVKAQRFLSPSSKHILTQLSRQFLLLNTPARSAAYKEPWEYIAHRLVQMGYKAKRTLRIKGALEEAYKSPPKTDNSAIIETFLDVTYLNVIFNDLFMTRKGELITIMTQNTSPETGWHLKHVLVSLGRGRFEGIGNDVLHPNLNPNVSVITADDLELLNKGTLFTEVPDPEREPLMFAVGTIKDHPEPPVKNGESTITAAPTTPPAPTITPVSDNSSETPEMTTQAPDAATLQSIPGPYLKDPWRKRKLWSNHYVLEHFIGMGSPGYLRLTNTHSEHFTMSLSSEQRLTMEWWLKPSSLGAKGEQGSPALLSSGKIDTPVFELQLSTYDRLVPIFLADPQVTYDLHTFLLNQNAPLVDEDFLLLHGGVSIQSSNLTLLPSSAVGDSLLVNLSAADINTYFTHYLAANEIQGRVNINALGLLDYMLNFQYQVDPTSWPTPITRNYLEERFDELTYSRVIAQILTEFLTLNVPLNSPSHSDTQYPVSASGIYAFLKHLVLQATDIFNQSLNLPGLSQDHILSQFNTDLSLLKEKLHANLATWIAVINYAGGLPESIMPKSQPLYNSTHTEGTTRQPFQIIGFITFPEDTLLNTGQNVNIFISDGTIKTLTQTVTLPAGFTSSSMAAYCIADAINRTMSKLKMPLSNGLEFTVVAGNLHNFDDGNTKYPNFFVRTTPGIKIFIHSDLNMLGIPRTFQVLVELADDDGYDPFEYFKSHMESVRNTSFF